eukprot:7223335-Prymnesium_polylepis.1
MGVLPTEEAAEAPVVRAQAPKVVCCCSRGGHMRSCSQPPHAGGPVAQRVRKGVLEKVSATRRLRPLRAPLTGPIARPPIRRVADNMLRIQSAPVIKKKFPKPGDVLTGVPPGPGETSIDMSIDVLEGRAHVTVNFLT